MSSWHLTFCIAFHKQQIIQYVRLQQILTLTISEFKKVLVNISHTILRISRPLLICSFHMSNVLSDGVCVSLLVQLHCRMRHLEQRVFRNRQLPQLNIGKENKKIDFPSALPGEKKLSGYCAWTNDKKAYYGAEKAGVDSVG